MISWQTKEVFTEKTEPVIYSGNSIQLRPGSPEREKCLERFGVNSLEDGG
jgi:hypothetical protein